MQALADLVYPQQCVGCSIPVRAALCHTCWEKLARVREPRCLACGKGVRGGCSDCRSRVYDFDSAGQPFLFTGHVRKAIHALKYKGERSLGSQLASALVPLVQDADAVCWVPASAAGLRDRGFNQAELLGVALSESVGIPAVGLLERIRQPAPQVSLKRELRLSNQKETMTARLLCPRRVICVDDVFTTGATASEAARALKQGGAERVQCLSVARAVSE